MFRRQTERQRSIFERGLSVSGYAFAMAWNGRLKDEGCEFLQGFTGKLSSGLIVRIFVLVASVVPRRIL